MCYMYMCVYVCMYVVRHQYLCCLVGLQLVPKIIILMINYQVSKIVGDRF